jgi:hypothetical protein
MDHTARGPGTTGQLYGCTSPNTDATARVLQTAVPSTRIELHGAKRGNRRDMVRKSRDEENFFE